LDILEPCGGSYSGSNPDAGIKNITAIASFPYIFPILRYPSSSRITTFFNKQRNKKLIPHIPKIYIYDVLYYLFLVALVLEEKK